MTRILPILAMFVILSSCNMFGGGESSVSWDDPAGDVKNRTFIAPKKAYKVALPALDIISATATAKEGHIVFSTKINGTFSEFFDFTDPGGLKHGGVLAEYFIDTDNKPETGATPTNHQRTGYDVGVRIMLGYKTSTGKIAGGGTVNTKTSEIVGPYATFAPKAMSPEIKTSAWLGTEERTAVRENVVEVRIPYEWMGLKAGDTVRICFKENYQATGSIFSEDKLLKLKK